jgi:hypothetical protein
VEVLHHLPGYTLQCRQCQQKLPKAPPLPTSHLLQQHVCLETQMADCLRAPQTQAVCQKKKTG